MDFQAAGNTPRLGKERESGNERDSQVTCFLSGVEEEMQLFTAQKAVLARTQAVAFLLRTGMKKSTTRF